MAWLTDDAKPMVAGWGPEPKLEAPSIGSLVSGILANRLGQQKLTQDSISEAIKNFQAQRQASAYGQALQSSGVVPQGVDLSNMSGPDLSKLADLYQGSIPDTDEDKAKQAIANYHNAAATSLWEYPGGKGTSGVDYSEHAIGDTWISEDGLRMIMTRTGPRFAPVGVQPTTARPQTQNEQLTEENRLLQQKSMMDQQSAAERQKNMVANKPNVPFSQADLYNRTVKRLQEIQRQRTMPHADQPQTQTDTDTDTGTTNQPQVDINKGLNQLDPNAQKRVLAQQALDDPQATDQEKAQARIILGQ